MGTLVITIEPLAQTQTCRTVGHDHGGNSECLGGGLTGCTGNGFACLADDTYGTAEFADVGTNQLLVGKSLNQLVDFMGQVIGDGFGSKGFGIQHQNGNGRIHAGEDFPLRLPVGEVWLATGFFACRVVTVCSSTASAAICVFTLELPTRIT